MEKKEYFKILRSGIRAPSVDNNQPWKFYLDKNKIYVILDRNRFTINDFTNRNNIADLVSLGACLENICIAGNSIGYESEIKYNNNFSDDLAGIVSFSEDKFLTGNMNSLNPFINKRITNRYKFNGVEINKNHFKMMHSLAAKKEANLQLIHEKSKILDLAGIAGYFDELLWYSESDEKRKNLLESFRFSEGEVNESKDGLSLHSLGLSSLERFAFSNVLKIANSYKSFYKLIGLISKNKSYNLIKSSSALFSITMPLSEKIDYIRGGQAFENIWLYLTSNGINFHPMVGTFFSIAYDYHKGEHSELNEKDKRTVKKIRKGFENYFELSKDNALIAFGRIGYSNKTPPETLRRDLGDVILS